MGRGGGNGPSLFELHMRAVARLGTTDAFEKAFGFAIRRIAPLANIPHIISGDINTTSRKRKGPATSTIHPTDTHRHNRVAVTTQVNRTVRGRLSFDFEPPQRAEMEPGESSRPPQHAVTELGESSRPPVSAVTAVTTLSSSTDDSAKPIASPEEPEFEVLADPEIAVPRPYSADPDEPVVLGVILRRRPNTRASMTRQRETINEVMQHGQAIEEQIVDKRF
ncbi:hypothetical protein R1sor_025316 [Riccia sorocarpa]|uniref:Uncharacterized protein n=1 Tax=Riccia sorocarpa TaxID=122646 RepID=A0ABD3G8T7_9MARC